MKAMDTKNDLFMRNTMFGWVAIATAAILAVPLIAMQFSDGVQWGAFDFVAMGIVLSGMGSAFVLAARKVRAHRLVLGALFLLALVYIWAELAVGIFTGLGS